MDIFNEHHAEGQDSQDSLRHLRDEFCIPTRAQLKHTTLSSTSQSTTDQDDTPSTYLCGNSLGLRPRLVEKYSKAYHDTWATKGVYGHFAEISDSPLAPWLHVDDDIVPPMAAIVGAQENEVAVMQTLTANLHLAMCTFYQPTSTRYKIILESKSFPSDHYAIESQIRHHGLDPSEAMITIEPPHPDTDPTLSLSHILSVIDAHATSTALLLLPGIQFYTGQAFPIATITSHAQSLGITVGWDLAHAVGNIPLSLHSWNVDFAVWCTYKYLNCGPGAIGGLFIHEKHSRLDTAGPTPSTTTEPGAKALAYKPRLAGWWGSNKASRFAMDNRFQPIEGAAGWQLSNPSVADLTNVRASMDVFGRIPDRGGMGELRGKSLRLTGYLEELLLRVLKEEEEGGRGKSFMIITPSQPEERGAQLSLKLKAGLLDSVMKTLEEEGVVVDERRPDVIRVAPAPLYNSFADVLRFVKVFKVACEKAIANQGKTFEQDGSVMATRGKDDKGWSEIK